MRGCLSVNTSHADATLGRRLLMCEKILTLPSYSRATATPSAGTGAGILRGEKIGKSKILQITTIEF